MTGSNRSCLAEARSSSRETLRGVTDQKIRDASVAQDHRNVRRCAAVTVCDVRAGAGREEPLDLLDVAADHCAVEQGIPEWALIVRVPDDDLVILHTNTISCARPLA